MAGGTGSLACTQPGPAPALPPRRPQPWAAGFGRGQPCLGRLGAIPFPAGSDCAVERRWGRAGPVPRAKVGCLRVGKGGRACPQEKARQLSCHLRPGQPVQPPVCQKHGTRLHPRTRWPRLLPLPGMPFPFHSSCLLCSSITSSVKLSLTSTVGCASTLLPEPHPLVTTLSVDLALL